MLFILFPNTDLLRLWVMSSSLSSRAICSILAAGKSAWPLEPVQGIYQIRRTQLHGSRIEHKAPGGSSEQEALGRGPMT